MHPILFKFGPLTLHTYGLLVAGGFLLGIAWAARLGKREGMAPQMVYDVSFWIILSAILSSRVLYVMVEYRHYLDRPLDVFKIWEGGLVFYGGVIGAVAAIAICARIYKFDMWKFADIAAPSAALGHAIGRLGCLFAGCCYGRETHVPWAVTFEDVHSIAPTGVPLHPTQIYDSLNEFTIFLIITAFRPYRKFKGQVWWIWVGLYSFGRMIVEGFRGDPRGMWLGDSFSTSQILAAGGILLAVIFYLRSRRLYKSEGI
ncbi:MAG: prolipoprotein diacylglyceryl transferase [Nitrospinae bacterium]|nr:prolipoprotein diacylglyceryl transferase [Nitrospinota bacterium]